jgi:hypothetical protein
MDGFFCEFFIAAARHRSAVNPRRSSVRSRSGSYAVQWNSIADVLRFPLSRAETVEVEWEAQLRERYRRNWAPHNARNQR